MQLAAIEHFEPELREVMTAVGTIKTVGSGEQLMDYGQTIVAIPILLSGSMKVLRLNTEGHELLLYYLKSGESCAMSFTCCMQAKKSEIKAVCEESAKLLMIPIEYIDRWMSTYPSFRAYVMSTIQARFDELMKTIDQVAFQKLDERLINYLKEKQRISGSAVIQQSHEQIALELATSRVVISRLLKKLELDKKVVLYRNEIKLLSAL